MDSSGWLAVPGAVGIGGARARRKGPPPQARRRADTCPRPSDYLVVSSRDRGHMICLGPRNIPQAGGPWPADTQTCHRSHSGLGGRLPGGAARRTFRVSCGREPQGLPPHAWACSGEQGAGPRPCSWTSSCGFRPVCYGGPPFPARRDELALCWEVPQATRGGPCGRVPL